MFKPGQKVVFVVGFPTNVSCVMPAINEIVTIKFQTGQGYFLEEYYFGSNGMRQSFHPDCFRPLSDILREQTEKDCERIEEGIYKLKEIEI